MDDSKFFGRDYEESMQYFWRKMTNIPDSVIDTVVELVSFLKYYFYINDTKTYDPQNTIQSHISKWEMKWIFKTLDFLKDMFVKSYDSKIEWKDMLTWHGLKELEEMLSSDYEERRQKIEHRLSEMKKKKQEKEIDKNK